MSECLCFLVVCWCIGRGLWVVIVLCRLSCVVRFALCAVRSLVLVFSCWMSVVRCWLFALPC